MSDIGMAGASSAHSGWSRIWQVLALIFAFYVLEQDVEALLWSTHQMPAAGTLGVDNYHDLNGDPGFAPGFVKVDHVNPGSPLANSGVATGDHLRFDPVWKRLTSPKIGEVFRFTLDHEGRKSDRVATAVPQSAKPHDVEIWDAVFVLVNLVTGVFAAFILLQGGRRPATLLLGLALSSFSLVWIAPQMWESAPRLFGPLYVLNNLIYASIFPLFLAFAVRYGEEGRRRRLTWEWVLVASYAAIYGAAVMLDAWCRWQITTLPLLDSARLLTQGLTYPGGIACLTFLFLGWKRSGPVERGRYAFLLVGFASILLTQVVIEYVDLGLNDPNFTANPLLIPCDILIGVVAPVLFAYAILRHRVLDLGFAINRTLVYTLVSAILLAAFGLSERGVDHLVSIEGREKNALVDAAIAVVIFLTFHRVRDVVEHAVERSFFQRWKQAADTLRQFVRTSAFATRAETLTQAFPQALSRFADGAPAAIYLLNDGDYRRVGGAVPGLPETLDTDDAILMKLRADPRPFRPEAGDSVVQAEVVAPMVHRNEVTGLALLGRKPSALDFRPDEIELIGWATTQIGLDVHALKVERLEESTADLLKKVGTLERALSLTTRPERRIGRSKLRVPLAAGD